MWQGRGGHSTGQSCPRKKKRRTGSLVGWFQKPFMSVLVLKRRCRTTSWARTGENRRCCCQPCPNHRTLWSSDESVRNLVCMFCCKLPVRVYNFQQYIVSCFRFRRDCVFVISTTEKFGFGDSFFVWLPIRESWRELRWNCVVKWSNFRSANKWKS